MNSEAKNRRRPPGPRQGVRARRRGGYTLIELALVIGILGLLALAVTDFYLGQLNLDQANRRVDGAVRDVQTILDASVHWKEANMFSHWPSDAATIEIDPLIDDGFLAVIPANRYDQCAGGCGDYTLAGWDRDANPTPPTGDYVDDPMDADDLVIQFNVWGEGDARLIASQLPHGRVLAPTAIQQGTSERTVEARAVAGVASGQFVRINNEIRPVRFTAGDLQGVTSITSEYHDGQTPATGPGLVLDAFETQVGILDGPKLVFETNEPVRTEVGLEVGPQGNPIQVGVENNETDILLPAGGDILIGGQGLRNNHTHP